MQRVTFIFVLFCQTYFLFGQSSEIKEGRYFVQPLDNTRDVQFIEAYNEQFDVFEERKICREKIWERKYHEGMVYYPNHTDDTWYIRRRIGYFWTFTWSEWKFCDNRESATENED